MKVGTKSILFGAHCWLIHPWFVAWAWWKLYGLPWDYRLWVAFFVHDLGYWGKPNMDGPEGERHVEFGANLMGRWFDPAPVKYMYGQPVQWRTRYWYFFCLYHSRFYAKRDRMGYSRLCVADKLAIALTPAWIYIPMATATGEIYEYTAKADPASAGKYSGMNVHSIDKWQWYRNVQDYLRRWVEEHKDGREDTWTPEVEK
jgi:hypothetical protein